MAIVCLRKWTDPSANTKFAAAGVMALEACVGVGAPATPSCGEPQAVAECHSSDRGRIVDRHGGAIATGIPLPDVVVGTLGGQALAGRDRVARPVGDAGESHGLAVVDVKHPAEGARDAPVAGGRFALMSA